MDNPVEYKLSEDDHENAAIVLKPQLEGSHRIVGLIEGRDFEAQLFVLDHPAYENLFEMKKYDPSSNTVEKQFLIVLKENNLEIDVFG